MTTRQPEFRDQKEALKRCLAREYRSFFRPFEDKFYSEDVTFQDPLNNLKGKDKYRKNVEMLSGDSFVGNILFSDGFIDLHAVEDVPGDDRRLRTRWTLGFTFKLAPWQPKALFSGISEYTIDSDAKVLSQRDYWDTLSLGSSGDYVPEAVLAGLRDLGEQLLPSILRSAEEPPAASAGDWILLRRAAEYRVYRRLQAGTVFAIGAPGAQKDIDSVTRAVKSHGLSPGGQLRVSTSGRGDLLPAGSAAAAAAAPADVVPGVELLEPHPWDGDPPPD